MTDTSMTRTAVRRAQSRGAGFTLIEVLVVVAIIALLTAILIPSLKAAKEQATGAVCKSNMHQLMIAMLTYTSEYRTLPATGGNMWSAIGRPTSAGWDWFPGDTWSGLLRSQTAYTTAMQQELWDYVAATVPQKGSIFKFAKSEKVYLCPADKKGYPDPEEPLGGGGNGRFSYTMNSFIGLRKPESIRSFTYVKDFKPVEVVLPAPRKLIPAGTTVKWPGSEMVVLMEEHPWNNLNHSFVNDGWAEDSYLVMRHNPKKLTGTTNFAYLDGHADSRRYPYVSTKKASDGSYPKLQGVDIFNQFFFPYSYDSNAGGAENAAAFEVRIRWPH